VWTLVNLMGIVWNSIHYTVQDSGDLFYFLAELREFFRDDGLHPVGKRPFRIVMNFHEQPVGPDSHRRARKRQYFVALACTVARVHKNRQMAALLYSGHDSKI